MREVGAVDGGVSVTEVDLLGRQVISEYVGGQVVHKLEEKERKVNKNFFISIPKGSPPCLVQDMAGGGGSGITIGEAHDSRGHRFDPFTLTFTFFHPMNAKSPDFFLFFAVPAFRISGCENHTILPAAPLYWVGEISNGLIMDYGKL
ncbi:hypothetical protein JHK87_057320 [Glycine soja]|nr:hypothetical protein JHK87_057320 [Glycine soja]